MADVFMTAPVSATNCFFTVILCCSLTVATCDFNGQNLFSFSIWKLKELESISGRKEPRHDPDISDISYRATQISQVRNLPTGCVHCAACKGIRTYAPRGKNAGPPLYLSSVVMSDIFMCKDCLLQSAPYVGREFYLIVCGDMLSCNVGHEPRGSDFRLGCTATNVRDSSELLSVHQVQDREINLQLRFK